MSKWVQHPAEWRQIGIVSAYMSLLGAMYFVPACRNVLFFGLACYFSFLNAVVIHNHMHQGVFRWKGLNKLWNCVLSFGSLYPASTNTPAHNLVHHHFSDDGRPDWATTELVYFRWNLLNLLHFPNVAGPSTFNGTKRWGALAGRSAFRRQLNLETTFAFGLTGLLAVFDLWTTLFFIVLPQLYGARGILRINLIQHDGCDITSTYNHSRNFVGRAFNWIMCNNGYHTIHHNRAGLHWSVLHTAHERDVRAKIEPSLDQRSMVLYLLRTYLFRSHRPAGISAGTNAEPASSPAATEPNLSEGRAVLAP